MSVDLNSSITVCIWLMQSSYSYFIDLLYTFSREMLSYLVLWRNIHKLVFETMPLMHLN